MGLIEGRWGGGIIVTAHGVQGVHKPGGGLHGLGGAAGGGRPSRGRAHPLTSDLSYTSSSCSGTRSSLVSRSVPGRERPQSVASVSNTG